VRTPRRLAEFGGALIATAVLVLGTLDASSGGRLYRQLRDFTFAGSGHSSLREGFHRFYQLALRNERSLPLLLVLGIAALAVAAVARRIGLYELGLLFALPVVVVVMRDFGAYENHLIDVEILCGLTVAGLWRSSRTVSGTTLAQVAIVAYLFVAAVAAARYTLVPDARAAAAHELRGRRDARYSLHPAPALVAQGTCVLFEDASLPILAGQQPVVLDAFITHRLQTEDPPALRRLLRRVEDGSFSTIALNFPLTNVGWFQTLDFGTALADAMRAHYRPAGRLDSANLYLYEPIGPRAQSRCTIAPLDRWR
jgi:hypothetical protein